MHVVVCNSFAYTNSTVLQYSGARFPEKQYYVQLCGIVLYALLIIVEQSMTIACFYTLLSFVPDVVGTISDRPPPMPLPTNRGFNHYQQDRKLLEYLFSCKFYLIHPPHLEGGGIEFILYSG